MSSLTVESLFRLLHWFSGATLIFFAPGMTIAATILVDFGGENITDSPTDGRFWNNITDPVAGSIANAVIAETGVPTGFSVAITVPFLGIDETGNAGVSPSLPVSATSDSFFGDEVEQGSFDAFSQIAISSLDPEQTYTLSLYASAADVPDRGVPHETVYAVMGLTRKESEDYRVTDSGPLLGVTFADSRPDPTGMLVLDVFTERSLFNPGSGFYHVGVLKIEYIPEPSTTALFLLGLGSCFLRRRASPRN